MKFYALSASKGDKVESSIKDFASVLHQCGRTSEAVSFLEKFKKVAKGGEKYRNLLENLRKQLTPSGKVFCKKLLLTNLEAKITKEEVE